ncbi:3840_t:CDS:1, partial [Gigaspora margarita]
YSLETNGSVEIAEEINSFSNTFGKDIVETSFPCEININKAYYEAWKEIIKIDKNMSKYKI